MTTFEDDRLSDDIAARHQEEREVCVCSHPLYKHHTLGMCAAFDGLRACPCLDYDEEQP